MGQQQRPFVADPSEWEVIDDENDLEVVEDTKKPTWSDSLGLNAPTTSPLIGFLRGAGSGVVDLAQGAVSNVTGQMNQKLDEENALRQAHGSAPVATVPRVANPESFAGDVGNAMPMMAEMAMPVGPGVSAVREALPSAARAGAKFEQVMGAAKDIVVDVEPTGKHALRILELSDSGATLPKTVKDFLYRVTNPKKAPMTYKQSRDFASNLSSLSANEKLAIKPVVRREIAQMAANLNKANAEAAKAAGKGAEYKSAMREYANAMRLKEAIEAAQKHSKKAALAAAGLGGAAYYFGKD